MSATQSNLIGLAGNLGMYSMGVPIGMVIDSKGPRPAVIAGAILLGLGYYPIKQAFDSGKGSVALLCLVSYLTGLGGCMAFAAAVKTSALNWPHHRGTATAFPLAAFGLSAFFFSAFGSLIVPGDTSAFLLLLAVGTFGMTFIGFFFLRVLPHAPVQHYHSVSGGDDSGLGDPQPLRRTISEEAKAAASSSTSSTLKRSSGRGRTSSLEEPGRSPANNLDNNSPYADEVDGDGDAYTDDTGAGVGAQADVNADVNADGDIPPPPPPKDINYATINAGSSSSSATAVAAASASASSGVFSAPIAAEDADHDPMDETSSLMSKSSSLPGEVLVQNSVDMDRSHRIDVRGWALLRNVEFWQFFAIMGILAGIGLMSIK